MVYAVWKLWLAPTIIAGISESDIGDDGWIVSR